MSVAAGDEFLHCSLRMLDAARAGEWEALVELEARRRELMSAGGADAAGTHAGADTGTGAAQSDAERLHRLLQINDEIIALSAQHRDELMRAFTSNRQQKRAAGAYSGAHR